MKKKDVFARLHRDLEQVAVPYQWDKVAGATAHSRQPKWNEMRIRKEGFAMKKKIAILIAAILLLCALGVGGTLARSDIKNLFAPEPTTTGFYEPLTQGSGTTAAGRLEPSYVIHGLALQVTDYSPETQELTAAFTNTSDRPLEWVGNESMFFQLYFWDGAKWNFCPLKEDWKPYAQPHNTGALPLGETVTVRYALQDYPPLEEGTRYLLEVWIRDPSISEEGQVNQYEISAEFALPLEHEPKAGEALWRENAKQSISVITAELESLGWKNIEVMEGNIDTRERWGVILELTEEEQSLFLYTITGQIEGKYDNPITAVVKLAFSDDDPEGKRHSVFYTSESGRIMDTYQVMGKEYVDLNALLSADDEILWDYMYSY